MLVHMLGTIAKRDILLLVVNSWRFEGHMLGRLFM